MIIEINSIVTLSLIPSFLFSNSIKVSPENRDIFITKQYIPVTSVKIALDSGWRKFKYAYIAVASNHNCVAVDWTEIKPDGSVQFNNMGTGIVSQRRNPLVLGELLLSVMIMAG